MKTTLLVLAMIFSVNLFAQKTVTVFGSYTCRAPENVSLEQAKKFVLEQAKLAALAEKFGTTISQSNSTNIINGDISFLSLSSSEVKGEWLEDIKIEYGKPDFDKEDMLILSVSVWGKAREITGAEIDFSAKVLNNADSKHETSEFHNGEDIYLSFRSPVNGYLAVYLVDEETAFCLLPYSGEPKGKTNIKSGIDYIFFSKKHATPTEKNIVTEYTLSCKKRIETNYLYIIFSPNEFIKANDIQATGEVLLPRELTREDFQKWLAKNKQRDKDLKVEIKTLTIKK